MQLRRKLLKALIPLVILGFVVAAIWFVVDYMSWKNIDFKLSSGTESVAVYGSDPDGETGDDFKSIASRDGSGVLRLKAGSYYVIPTGGSVADDPIRIEITDATTEVTIAPYNTASHLLTAFSAEIESINGAINAAYPGAIEGYTIDNGTFYHYGDWYGTTIHSNDASRGIDTYGVILRKSDGAWKIVASPKILFPYSEHKDIPADIIRAVNRAVNSL